MRQVKTFQRSRPWLRALSLPRPYKATTRHKGFQHVLGWTSAVVQARRQHASAKQRSWSVFTHGTHPSSLMCKSPSSDRWSCRGMRQRMAPPRSLKWQQGLRCRCSPSATSGKDAARDPPPFSSASSYVVTGLAQSNHRRGDVGEKQARAASASRLLRSSSILDFFF